MGGLLSRQRRRAPHPSLVQGLALLHGRALHLPPAALPARTYPANHPIAAGLRPFRMRLHLQRAAVTVLRALALAALAAIAILLVRLAGIGMPPLAPLLGAGVVFVAALGTILWQRPSTPQMAHALDQRLGLREQIGSALELEPSSSRLAALLYQRTTAALQSANPAYILPWPSLRRERISLIILGLVAGLCALLAAHAPPPRQLAAPTVRTDAARRSGPAQHHARRLPVRLLALGTASARPAGRVRATTPASPGMRLAAGQGRGGQVRGRVLPGSALSLHTGGRPGQGSPVSGDGRHSGANPLASNKAGRAAGRGSALHLASGKNSTAGGVVSPQQQALEGLRNSIASAQAAPTRATQGIRRNAQGQAQSNGSAGRQGLGRGNATGGAARGRRSSAHGQPAGGAASRPGASSSGRSSDMLQWQAIARSTIGGDADPLNRYGHAGGGTGPQSGGPGDNTSRTNRSAARLADNQGITLNGAPGAGGPFIVSQGEPTRAPGVSGSSLYGAPGGVAVTVPGYVAPDRNTVAPDERSLIRQYFSPTANSQGS